MEYTTVPFDAEAAGVLTVDEARARLAATEPLDSLTFWTGDEDVGVIYGKGWAEGELTGPAAVWLRLAGGQVLQMTRQAAQQLGSTCKVNKKYQEFLSPELLTSVVNYALHEGLGECELKLMTAGYGTSSEGAAVPLAVAQGRATVVPFSNVRLLDIVLLAVRAKLGEQAADSAVVDFKFFHDLEHTSFRVLFPVVQQVVAGTGEADDAWCYGIEVSNSLIGNKQTIVSGYLFRLSSAAGITDIEHTAGGFSRRGSMPDDVFDWAAEAVGDILKGLEAAFEGLQVLTGSVVDGEYDRVLDQLFRDSPVAKELKLRIISALEAAPSGAEFTMLDLAHAAADAANLDDSSWREVRSLLDLAGHIVHQGGGMCRGQLPSGCRHLLSKDWEAPEAS